MIQRLGTLLVALSLAFTAPSVDAQVRVRFAKAASYSTTFQTGTENPISEGGTGWVQGGVDGVDWSNFQTTTGKAFGTQSAGSHGNCGGCTYNDSTALKRPPTGTVWTKNIDIRARVFITSRTGWSGFHEVELLHGQIIANSTRIYEGIFSVTGGTTYYQGVRWEGAIGTQGCAFGCAFTEIYNVSCAGVEDGTYIRFTHVGSTLTQYTSSDGVTWSIACGGTATGTDTAYTGGMPGMGHWTNGNGAVNTYGLSEWSAREYRGP